MSDRDDIAELLLAQQGDSSAVAPGFYGNDEAIANRQIPPGDLTPNWNKYIYEGTDRPTMARDESIGPEQFTGFRQSPNVDDRRFDPALTDEQKARFLVQSGSPRGQFRYTPAEHLAAQAQAETPLAKALGSGLIANLEATADARRMAQQSALAKGEIETPTRARRSR